MSLSLVAEVDGPLDEPVHDFVAVDRAAAPPARTGDWLLAPEQASVGPAAGTL